MERGTTDWARLRAAATEAARRAYAPYSRLQVGAAGLTAAGLVVVGSNVENASYGLTLCAECSLVSALHGAGPQPAADAEPSTGVPEPAAQAEPPALVAVAVVAADGAPLLPCGRCRQLLLEAGGPGLLVDTAAGPRPISSLLPAAFDAGELAARRPGASTTDEHA
jgi:cytidine deaminase